MTLNWNSGSLAVFVHVCVKVLAINTSITVETGSIYMCVGLDCYTLSFACFALYEECRTLWHTGMHVHAHDLMYALYMYAE